MPENSANCDEQRIQKAEFRIILLINLIQIQKCSFGIWDNLTACGTSPSQGYRVYTSRPSPPQSPSPKIGRGGGQTRLSGSSSPALGEGVGG